MQNSKISRFPRHIREELNQRLDRSEKQNRTLEWVNSLPEVQAILKEEFEGEPVKKQNLTKWKKHGFRNWQLHQSAATLTASSPSKCSASAATSPPKTAPQTPHV